VAEKASFVSRFLYKILEIMGAAVATAVSGYIVAHMGGFLPSQSRAPTPPEIVAAPSENSPLKNTPAIPPPSQTATVPQPTQSAATPAATESRPPASQQDATGAATQTVVRKSAKASPVRKSNKADAAASDIGKPRETPEAKPRDAAEAKSREAAEAKAREAAEAKAREAAEAKARDAAEAKAREAAEAKAREAAEAKARDAEDKESVEARVRAALANVDANRPSPSAEVTLPHRGNGQTGAGSPRPGEALQGSAVATPARPLELPSAPAGAGQQPRSADLGSTAQQPGATQSPAAQPAALSGPAPAQAAAPSASEALTTVEIKSLPVATVDTPRVPEQPPPPPEERGVFQTLKRILPDFSRPASSDDTPRPPAPVGE